MDRWRSEQPILRRMVASTVGLCACGLLCFGLIVAQQSQPKDLDAVAERMPDETVLRGATFLVGHRLYQIAITTTREEGAPSGAIEFYQAAASEFLESLRLIAP